MRKIFLIFIIVQFAVPLVINAHDLHIDVRLSPPVVVLEAGYPGEEKLSYAEVLIYAPEEKDIESQNGRTDANGRFSFQPDRAGTWTATVDDEMGHKITRGIEIDEKFLARENTVKQSGANYGVAEKLIIGLSLIFGATGIYYWYKTIREKK